MTRRKRLLAAVAGVIALMGCVGIAVYVFTQPRVIVTPERVAQVRPGMPIAEVEAIFSGPPGNYYDDDALISEGTEARVWATQHGGVVIVFDEDYRVTTAEFFPYGPVPWYRRLWYRLGF